MRTEELLAAADVLVTDYSSVLFDAMACRLPIVLYAPDVEEYKDSRGFYLKYESIPAAFAADGGSLARVLADPDTYKEVGSPRYEAFYNAEQKYGVNGIFIAAIGIHESAWGTSYLAKEKNNLFGYKAYDRDPINSAQDFDSYVDAINVVAEALSKNYLTQTGSFFNGYTVEAVNQKYATDKSWHEKVFSYMELLYDKLG